MIHPTLSSEKLLKPASLKRSVLVNYEAAPMEAQGSLDWRDIEVNFSVQRLHGSRQVVQHVLLHVARWD